MSNHVYRHVHLATLSLAVAGLLCVGTSTRAQSNAPIDNRGAESRSFQDNNGRRTQLTQFDDFLDSHPEIAEQLRRNPSLADDRTFVQNHPALQDFLQKNPDIRYQLRQDPNVFMRQENRFDRREDARDGQDVNRRDLADFGRFLGNHREIAEQVRRNPSLVENREFVQNHPALQSYLQNNPEVRDQIRQDPNGFMRDENRSDRFDAGRTGNPNRDHMASFGEFLGRHERIHQDVSKDPTLVKNREYLDGHRDLDAYLNQHPDVKQDWASNPHEFVKGAQQFTDGNSNSASSVPGTTPGSTPTGHSMTNGTNSKGGANGNAAPNPAPQQSSNKPKQ